MKCVMTRHYCIWSGDKREKKCHFFNGFVKSLAHCKREHNRSAKRFTILIAFGFLFEATLIVIIWLAAFGFGLFTRTNSMRLGGGTHTHTPAKGNTTYVFILTNVCDSDSLCFHLCTRQLNELPLMLRYWQQIKRRHSPIELSSLVKLNANVFFIWNTNSAAGLKRLQIANPTHRICQWDLTSNIYCVHSEECDHRKLYSIYI